MISTRSDLATLTLFVSCSLLTTLHLSMAYRRSALGLNGSIIKCRVEGESIQVPAHLRQPCIWCKCQNHQVVCQKRSPCPVECLNQTKSDSHCEHNVLQTSSSLSLSRLQLNVSASSLASSKTLQIKPLFGECVLSSIESRYFITNYDGSRFRFGNRFRCNHLFSRTCRPIDVASIVSPTNHGQPSLITMPDIQFSVQLHNSRSAFGRQVVQRNGSLNESVVLPFDLLLIHLDSVRIEVDSQLQARVNNETIRLPFVRLGVFTVAATHSNTVTIRITNGPRIIWSASKVSVRVPNRLRNQMCGLCGNFNHQIGDDFRSQSGRPLFRSKAFFSEWMVNPDCALMENTMSTYRSKHDLFTRRKKKRVTWGATF